MHNARKDTVMDWNMIELIIAIAAVWVGSGTIAAGWLFASTQRDNPNFAADNYDDYVVIFWFMWVCGAISFVTVAAVLIWRRDLFRGILFPWNWRREQAIEMQLAYREHPWPTG